MESELSKKLEITENEKEDNDEEEEGSKGEYFFLSVLTDHIVLSSFASLIQSPIKKKKSF